jgi:hypothetical protein
MGPLHSKPSVGTPHDRSPGPWERLLIAVRPPSDVRAFGLEAQVLRVRGEFLPGPEVAAWITAAAPAVPVR